MSTISQILPVGATSITLGADTIKKVTLEYSCNRSGYLYDSGIIRAVAGLDVSVESTKENACGLSYTCTTSGGNLLLNVTVDDSSEDTVNFSYNLYTIT